VSKRHPAWSIPDAQVAASARKTTVLNELARDLGLSPTRSTRRVIATKLDKLGLAVTRERSKHGRRLHEHVCLSCGTPFQKPSGAGCLGKYCSRRCIPRDGHSEIQRDELTPFRFFVSQIRNRCKNNKRGKSLTTSLTSEQCKEIWDAQNGICPYTGWKLELPPNAGGFRSNPNRHRAASIDRIKSDGHYTKDNIQFVAMIANYAKNNFPDSVFIEFCHAVAKHRPISNFQPQ